MTLVELGRSIARTNAVRFVGHPPHTHDVPHLVYMVTGTGVLTVEGRAIHLGVGQSAWLPADVEHSLVLAASGMALGPFLDPSAVPPGGLTRVLGADPTLAELVMVVLCTGAEDDAERDPLRAAFEEVLRSITQEHFPLVLPQHPGAHSVALEAAGTDETLDELAARHYLSARHAQRLFLEETGLTFSTWRTRARLNRAVVSLRAGEGLRTVMHTAGFTTRHGLLKALSRECDLPLEALRADPQRAVSRLIPLAR